MVVNISATVYSNRFFSVIESAGKLIGKHYPALFQLNVQHSSILHSAIR